MAGGLFHILIADDDEDDRFILCDAIKARFGASVCTSEVSNGMELIGYLERALSGSEGYVFPDVVLLDINMPLLDGFETLGLLKQQERFRSLPVYMLTTMRDAGKASRLQALGAADFFTKPNHRAGYDSIVESVMAELTQNSR